MISKTLERGRKRGLEAMASLHAEEADTTPDWLTCSYERFKQYLAEWEAGARPRPVAAGRPH